MMSDSTGAKVVSDQSQNTESLKIQSMLLRKLIAQISIYSGNRLGGLASLQDLISRMEVDGQTTCEACGETGYRGRTPIHKEDCPIVLEYNEVFKITQEDSTKAGKAN